MHPHVNKNEGVFPSVCSLDCPDQCGLLVHKKAGKIVKIEGDPEHPVTKGAICNKVRHMTDRLYDPHRLKTPLKRIGKKGRGNLCRFHGRKPLQKLQKDGRILLQIMVLSPSSL